MSDENHSVEKNSKRPTLRVFTSSKKLSFEGGAVDERTAVLVLRGRIDQTADEAVKGIFSSGSPYYQRGGVLVRLVRGSDLAKKKKYGCDTPSLIPATLSMILDDLERTCRFISQSENSETGETRTRIVSCPKALPGVIHARAGRLPVPEVRGIAEVPLLHEDGSMVWDGYDQRAGVVVVAPGPWPAVPEYPTEKDARKALEKLEAIISGFPFVSDTDRSVSLSSIISAVLRPTLPSCPAFGGDASAAGSGKGKLMNVPAVLAQGRTAAALTWPPKEDEAEKRLGAAVMSGDAVILLDNIDTPLRGACLNSLLTEPTVSLRPLGQSKVLRLSASVLVLATGNNLVLSGDLNRRFLVARLDPEMERPELRRFEFDPVVKAKAERGALVAAVHTIAKWGLGKHTSLAPLGSFEVWSRRVRDPLVALGLPDCCGALEKLHKADPERETALELLSEWHRCFGGDATTVASAIRAATSRDTALRDALDAVAGGPGGLNAKRLGRYMNRIRDRVFGTLVLRQHRDLVGNVASWAVETQSPGFRVTEVSSIEEKKNINSGLGLEVNPVNPVTRRDSAGGYILGRNGADS